MLVSSLTQIFHIEKNVSDDPLGTRELPGCHYDAQYTMMYCEISNHLKVIVETLKPNVAYGQRWL